MLELADFDRQLRAVATAADGRLLWAKDGWPFVCDGSPIGCEVFIVGINPGTATPFWPHWSATEGFRREDWLEDYKRRDGRFTKTRHQIERLVKAIEPVRCLETNVYASFSRRLAELPKVERVTRSFDWLVKTLQPRVMFVHGKKAREHLERTVQMPLPLNEFQNVHLNGTSVSVLATHHLSYQTSIEACERLGVLIRERATS